MDKRKEEGGAQYVTLRLCIIETGEKILYRFQRLAVIESQYGQGDGGSPDAPSRIHAGRADSGSSMLYVARIK